MSRFVALALVCGLYAAPEAASLKLDGSEWRVTVTPDAKTAAKGEKAFNDTLIFNAGKMTATACSAYGFKPSNYRTTAIAGGWRHGLAAVSATLETGELLMLVAEAGNPHDPNAVAVLRHGLKLGYVPREANAPVALLLEKGRRVECRVAGRLDIDRAAEIPGDLVFTAFARGDPRIELTLAG